jgi:hypothetical protein
MPLAWRLFVVSLSVSVAGATSAADWQPAKGFLPTRWTKDVSPSNAHPEYPRPQMVRKDWLNLNGLWQLAIQPKDAEQPSNYAEQILVPFPVESGLSGVMKRPSENDRLWYRRTFEVPAKWRKSRVLLHFGAVDWETRVWVNGQEVGSHTGGYDGFTFDVTSALKPAGDQEIVVSVWDPTDAGSQPIGKQTRNPRGILYTPTTGIWQTVWLEPVPRSYVKSLKITPSLDDGCVYVTVDGSGSVALSAFDGSAEVSKASGPVGKKLKLPVPDAKLWSPDSPFLYGLKVQLLDSSGKRVDEVQSYFGMRKISLGRGADGVTRIFVNDRPQFLAGPLDQGFWPDGIYTAPTDKALRYDIEMTKKLGFNMARKHVKVEPERWYYWCDRLGLLVFQDMPSGNTERDPVGFEKELRAMIAGRYNSPCIAMWVVFNEGWGQHDTPRYVKLVKSLDPTRLVDNASGWTDQNCGDVIDMHNYPGPGSPEPSAKRAAVLGEFGGLGLPVPGHRFTESGNWGYKDYADRKKLSDAIVTLFRNLRPLIASPGLSAAVYTQTTDVELESNGFMTYDRALVKGNPKAIRDEVLKLYLPPPVLKQVVPTSQRRGIAWKYTTDKPAEDWYKPSYKDGAWSQGPGGFGTKGTPGAVVRTEWKTDDIWLRRTFEVPVGTEWTHPTMAIHHDEDVEVYVDGKLIASLPGYITAYTLIPLSKTAGKLLTPGKHMLAVHCHQTTGGQYVDVGFVDVLEANR